MAPSDPRIRNALLSLNPTAKRPAWHGAQIKTLKQLAKEAGK